MNLIILCLLCQTELFEPAKVGEFADHLYKQQDYAAALNEYRRYLFLSGSANEKTRDRIIDCLIRLGRNEEAIVESEKIDDVNKRNFTKGMVYFSAGDFDSSRAYLQSVGVPYIADARRLIGLGYAYDHRFDKAGEYIELPARAPAHKSPVLGGLLSVVPGGGHIYAGRVGDGIYSFLIVGTAALLSYYYYDRNEDVKFGFTLGAAILLYAGNIYGGINAVRNHNEHIDEEFFRQILQDN
jgi:tetratricopeptide (TPR) repeat protein